VVAVGALTAFALAGCFPAPPTQDGRAEPTAVTPVPEITDPHITAFCPPMVGQHLDAVVSPVDLVYSCRSDIRMDTDGLSSYGPWQVAFQLSQPSALLTAYAAPNAPSDPRVRCPFRIVDPLIVWVDRGGVVSAYYAPVDRCGVPTTAAANAYRTARRDVVADVDTGAPGYQPTPAPTRKDR
jgi:hypothetical protein